MDNQNLEWAAVGIGGAMLIGGIIAVSNSIFFPSSNNTPKHNTPPSRLSFGMNTKSSFGGKKSKKNKKQ